MMAYPVDKLFLYADKLELKGNALVVTAAIASLANHGIITPSIAQLSQMLGISRRYTQFVLADLRQRGVLEVKLQSGDLGQRAPNEYSLKQIFADIEKLQAVYGKK